MTIILMDALKWNGVAYVSRRSTSSAGLLRQQVCIHPKHRQKRALTYLYPTPSTTLAAVVTSSSQIDNYPAFSLPPSTTAPQVKMATRVLESRFETMTVSDENGSLDGTKGYMKQVCRHSSVAAVNALADRWHSPSLPPSRVLSPTAPAGRTSRSPCSPRAPMPCRR